MLPKPRADLKPNTLDFERVPLVKPTGFREYDARWLFPDDINLMGLNAIGLGLATLAEERGISKRFVVGHDFRWYDYLLSLFASYGYVAMAHQNDTVPGVETASETTLLNTDEILEDQATIDGGALDGHIDARHIVWIGHSRGGEGVVRAYDRMRDEGYTPAHFGPSDIVLISSIAPTDFLGTFQSDPHGVPYHLLYGAADSDRVAELKIVIVTQADFPDLRRKAAELGAAFFIPKDELRMLRWYLERELQLQQRSACVG